MNELFTLNSKHDKARFKKEMSTEEIMKVSNFSDTKNHHARADVIQNLLNFSKALEVKENHLILLN